MRHSTPSEAELAKAELGYPGHCVLDPAVFVTASVSPLQRPASLPCSETPSPSPLPLFDLFTHTTLLKASEGHDGWSTSSIQEQFVSSLFQQGQASPRRRAL